ARRAVRGGGRSGRGVELPELREQRAVEAERLLRLRDRGRAARVVERERVEQRAVLVLEDLGLGDLLERVEAQARVAEAVVALEHDLDDLAAREIAEVAGVRVGGVRRERRRRGEKALDVTLRRGQVRDLRGPVRADEVG